MPLYVFFATFALFSPYFLLFHRSLFVQPYPFFYFLRGKYFSSKILDFSLLLLRFIVSCSFCSFSNNACRASSFTTFPISCSTIRQFVDVDKFFSYILVKEIDVINAISVLLLILILTLSLVLLTLLVTHIFAIKITSQEIFVIFQIYHYSMFYSFFYLFLSFVLSHLIERIFFISQ